MTTDNNDVNQTKYITPDPTLSYIKFSEIA